MSANKSQSYTYAQAGVDIDAGNALVNRIKPIARTTMRPGSEPELGGFGGLFDLKGAGYHNPILVAANDGVGTKVKIAIDTGIHDTLGIDLVAMCVNDLIVQGAEPLFFLDYLATGALDVDIATTLIEGIAEGCRQAGAALIGGETAEMPGLYKGHDYDLAGFAVGAVEHGALLPRTDIEKGDVLIGLASNGLHSNGFSLVRHLIQDHDLDWHDKAPFQPTISLGNALLTPTRIYVRPLLDAIRKTGNIKAIAHITGGGLTENLPRILPNSLSGKIDLASFPCPPIFPWLSSLGNIAQDEMLRTFNCGIGMVLIAHPQDSQAIIDILISHDENACIIGEIIPREREAIRFLNHLPQWKSQAVENPE